jgi:hypothetical protein
VWAQFVVVLAKTVELRLQFGQGVCGGLCGEEAFEGLVESFDFALRLRMPG